MSWDDLLPLLREFWRQAQAKLSPRYAPGRLKQWLAMLTRSYPEAVVLFAELRREDDCVRISRLLGLRCRRLKLVLPDRAFSRVNPLLHTKGPASGAKIGFFASLLKAFPPTLSLEYAMPKSGRVVTYLLNLRSL